MRKLTNQLLLSNMLKSFDPDVDAFVSVFELNIRVLGGLLSAFALTKDAIFRQKAEVIGQILRKAFKWPSGLPSSRINLKTGEWVRGKSRKRRKRVGVRVGGER